MIDERSRRFVIVISSTSFLPNGRSPRRNRNCAHLQRRVFRVRVEEVALFGELADGAHLGGSAAVAAAIELRDDVERCCVNVYWPPIDDAASRRFAVQLERVAEDARDGDPLLRAVAIVAETSEMSVSCTSR